MLGPVDRLPQNSIMPQRTMRAGMGMTGNCNCNGNCNDNCNGNDNNNCNGVVYY